MSFITAIGTAVPQYKYSQEELAEFMAEYMDVGSDKKRVLDILYARSAINSRYSVLPDFSRKYSNHTLFSGEQAGIGERMAVFNEEAPELALEAAIDALHDIELKSVTHLITVSCTGMSAPGLEIQVAERLGISQDTIRLSVNFMGCYAAFHALKIADSICRADPKSRVLIVSVELCSIHFLRDGSDDNMRANALFGDGAAAVVVTGSEKSDHGWQLKSFFSRLLPQGKRDMSWEIGADAFKMRLTSYIPQLVKDGVKPLLEGSLNKFSLKAEHINHWAIHPGGIKILEAVEEIMKLDKDALSIPREILNNYGNMSSPTILFVLKELWKARNEELDELIFSAGFGPGLTLESCLIEQVGKH